MKKTIISLGGSIVIPEKIDTRFIKRFKKVIYDYIGLGNQCIIVVGGGATARMYQKGARKIGALTRDDLDWLGIHATRINAHLLRTVFKKYAYPNVVTDPRKKEGAHKKIIIASGWKPGWSTDYVGAQLAKTYKVKKMINISNIDFVYTKDPKKFKNAKKITSMSWKELRGIVGNTWKPGINLPFDPIASRLAEKISLELKLVNGKKITEVKRCLEGKSFKGTVIT